MPSAPPRLSRPWRALLGLAVAAALLAAGEGVARLVLGPPPPCQLVMQATQCRLAVEGGQAWVACQPPIPHPRRLAVARRPGAARVVVLGASSMAEPRNRAVPEQLARALAGVEVLNLAVDGLQVANLAWLAGQIAPLDPDLALIYIGHNAYNATIFDGSVRATRLRWLPVYRALGHLWLHRAVEAWRETHLLDGPRRPGSRSIALSDDAALRVRARMDRRFRVELAEAVERSPAPVLLATLMRNPWVPPEGVLADDPARCQPVLDAVGPGTARDARALARLAEATRAACGEDNALLPWIAAHRARLAGDEATALERWRESLRRDALPLAAPPEADAIIREVAAEAGAPVVDLAAELGAFPPASWFTDAIHLSPEGAAAVAEAMAPAVREALADAAGAPPP